MTHAPPVVPLQAPGLLGATYHPPGEALEPEEVDGLRCRPLGRRTTPPRPGDVVGVRRIPHGPVVRAVVHEVDSLTDPWAHERDAFEPHGPDQNVWRVVTNAARSPLLDAAGRYVHVLREDPWPNVVVTIEPDDVTGKGARQHLVTREARRPGDAGWTPADQIGA